MEHKDTVTKKNRLRKTLATVVAWFGANKAFAIVSAIALSSIPLVTFIDKSFIDKSLISSKIIWNDIDACSFRLCSKDNIFEDFSICLFNSCKEYKETSDITCWYGLCTKNKVIPYIPYRPEPVVVKREDCATYGRFSKQLTNIAPSDLVVYPNPNETINSFYLQWTNQNLLVADDGGLKKYMQRKLNEIYEGAKLVRLFDGLGPNKNEYMWTVDLPKPLTLQEFSKSVGDAFVKDTAPIYENDPDIDYKRRALCQIEMIQPIRFDVPNAAIVNYNDPSLRYREKDIDIFTQSHIDINDRSTWPYFADVRDPNIENATDALKMHATYDLVKDKKERSHVDIAVIDSYSLDVIGFKNINGVYQGVGSPRIKKLEGPKLDYDPSKAFPHATQVLFRMAAPSNDDLYNAGVIPNEVLDKYVSIGLFPTDASGFSLNGESLNSFEVMTVLGKGRVRKKTNECFFLSCFTGTALITYDFYPDIINISMGVRLDASKLVSELSILKDIEFYKKHSCGGPGNEKLLNSREHQAPIITGTGNDNYTTNAFPINCGQHFISVGGASRESWVPQNLTTSAFYDEGASSTWGLRGNYVASRYDALLPRSQAENKGPLSYIYGTSLSAPTITGTLATLMSMPDEFSIKDFSAPALYQLMVNSSKIPMKFIMTDFRKNDSPKENVLFINSDCVFRYYLRNVLQFKADIIRNDNEKVCKGF